MKIKKIEKDGYVCFCIVIPKEAEDDVTEWEDELLDILHPLVYLAVAGFVQIAENTLTPEDRCMVIESLDEMRLAEGEIPALKMLYTMFAVAGLRVSAAAMKEAMEIVREFPECYELFMDEFFDSDEIDDYVMESWLHDYEIEENAVGVLS